tara:strand:+ start:210 stop:467 length:258 start_codon:yes stop_codon:yes gene_type:complete
MLKKYTKNGLDFVSTAGATSISKNGKLVATIDKHGNKGSVLRAYDNTIFISTLVCGKKTSPKEQKIKGFDTYKKAKEKALELWGV